MSWFSDMFTGGAADLVDSIGGALDELITSDDERLAAKNKLQSLVNDFKVKTLDAAAQQDKEVTSRHMADMSSDSWLSKNIRPMGLLFMLVTTVVLVYTTTFSDLTTPQIDVLKSWITPIVSIVSTIIVFYYGSRGFEKVKKIGK